MAWDIGEAIDEYFLVGRRAAQFMQKKLVACAMARKGGEALARLRAREKQETMVSTWNRAEELVVLQTTFPGAVWGLVEIVGQFNFKSNAFALIWKKDFASRSQCYVMGRTSATLTLPIRDKAGGPFGRSLR